MTRAPFFPSVSLGLVSDPTPFTEKLKVNVSFTQHIGEHYRRSEMVGPFLAGTCGDAPWMAEREKRVLVGTAHYRFAVNGHWIETVRPV